MMDRTHTPDLMERPLEELGSSGVADVEDQEEKDKHCDRSRVITVIKTVVRHE